ncbi:MAG TPA: class I SAM-dependent methyltransferase [Candidatus Rifleibacterium sp.]|nr:class I SAM-dependent methyltransferase [Candidatus Rifleibacterium sp.]
MNSLKKLMRRFLQMFGLAVYRYSNDIYDEDGLRSIHNHDFIMNPSFGAAYDRGLLASGDDYNWRWRVHVGLWAADCASKLEGDFVECGVNKGFLSSSVMKFLDWNKLNKTFYLLDTFKGIDLRFVSEQELGTNNFIQDQHKFYIDGVESVRKNFAEWQRVKIIVGAVPETLGQVDSDSVAFLHIDMNCVPPEVAAFNYFWDKMVPGGIILLDDYAYKNRELQKKAMDEVAAQKNVMILSLPTGQGLILKPSRQ